MAQIKLLSVSNKRCWSPEEYVVTRGVAGDLFGVREVNKNCPSIHTFESEVMPSELIGGPRPGSMCSKHKVFLCPFCIPVDTNCHHLGSRQLDGQTNYPKPYNFNVFVFIYAFLMFYRFMLYSHKVLTISGSTGIFHLLVFWLK